MYFYLVVPENGVTMPTMQDVHYVRLNLLLPMFINGSSNVIVIDMWLPSGDPRRPYPQDIEMRAGFLGRLSSPSSVGQAKDDAGTKPPESKTVIGGAPLRVMTGRETGWKSDVFM